MRIVGIADSRTSQAHPTNIMVTEIPTEMEPKRVPHPQARPKIRLFIEGRYQELVRDLPQTVFFCPECKGRRRRKGSPARAAKGAES